MNPEQSGDLEVVPLLSLTRPLACVVYPCPLILADGTISYAQTFESHP